MLDSRYYMFPFISLHRFTYTCSSSLDLMYLHKYHFWIPLGPPQDLAMSCCIWTHWRWNSPCFLECFRWPWESSWGPTPEGWNLSRLFSGNRMGIGFQMSSVRFGEDVTLFSITLPTSSSNKLNNCNVHGELMDLTLGFGMAHSSSTLASHQFPP